MGVSDASETAFARDLRLRHAEMRAEFFDREVVDSSRGNIAFLSRWLDHASHWGALIAEHR
ncbi:hypothetical protein N9V84_06450 [Verrucomicrobiales bacterium]|nr:hypothetical protein [Verrucomicrobiales bacterium]